MPSLIERIKSDERVVKSLRRLKKSELDLTALSAEINTMHASRATRALKSKALLQSSAAILIEATTVDMTYRSRCTAIRMTVLEEKLSRDEALSNLRKYILIKFSDTLRKKYKTITAQKAFVEVILEPYTSASKRMDHILQLAVLVSDDIDQIGWGLKLIKETLEALRPERYK